MQDGGIKVLDLETKSVIRTIVGHEVRRAIPFSSSLQNSLADTPLSIQAAILSLSRLGSDLYSSSADGRISVSLSFSFAFRPRRDPRLRFSFFRTPRDGTRLSTALLLSKVIEEPFSAVLDARTRLLGRTSSIPLGATAFCRFDFPFLVPALSWSFLVVSDFFASSLHRSGLLE